MQYLFESREDRYHHIDGLRALSVIWMIGYHSVFYLGSFISKNEYLSILGQQQYFRILLDGLLGVDVFFSISGFLITSILLNEISKSGSVQFGSFYARRFFRIVPAYLAALFLRRLFLGGAGMESIWANFFIINNYIPITSQFMGWAWSLAMEGQFYLFFPILMLLIFKVTKRPAVIVFVLLLSSLVFRYFIISGYGLQELLPFTPFSDHIGFSQWFDNWYDKTHLRCSGILVGSLAAFLNSELGLKKYFNANRGYAKILLLLAAIYFIWSITSQQTCVFEYCSGTAAVSIRVLYETLKHFMVSLIVASLILYCAGPGSRGIIDNVLSSKVWRPFAEMSLSAYLLHPIIIILFYSSVLTPGSHPTQSMLLCYVVAIVSITFLASFIMYLIIEMPFRKLGRGVVAN